MRYLAALVFLLLAVPGQASVMRCDQETNFACATADDTITGIWTFNSSTPFVFEGSTVDANDTTVSVINPTGARTMVIPNANSAVPTGVNLPCAVGHISDFNVATGVFTCTADSGGGTHNLLSATHGDTTTPFTPVQGDLISANGSNLWTRFARGVTGEVLQTAGSSLVWGQITSANIALGALSGVVSMNTILGGTWPAKTLGVQPATADTFILHNNGATLTRVGSCAGVPNTYTYTAPLAVAMCETTDPGAPGNVVIAALIVR